MKIKYDIAQPFFLKQAMESRENIYSPDGHVMELVQDIKNILYINNASAVILNDTIEAVNNIEAPVVLIIGGNDEDNDYSYLKSIPANKLKAIIYLGTGNERILKHYKDESILFALAENIEDALKRATYAAKPGDAVLFSPSCKSENYKALGNTYRALVNKLKK